MSIFKRNNPIEKLRADISGLEARRASLQQQRTSADVSLETARSTARDALIAGDDVVDDGAVIAAERRVRAIDDALAEIARRVEDANAALAEAEDTKAREDEAKSREAAAAKVEQIAVKLERAIGDVAALAGELREALPACLDVHEYREYWGDAGALSPDALVRTCVGEGLFAAAPQLFDLSGREAIGQFYEARMPLLARRPDGTLSALFPKESAASKPLLLSGAVDANIIEPLRLSAALIRSGELPADAPATPQPQPAHREAAE